MDLCEVEPEWMHLCALWTERMDLCAVGSSAVGTGGIH